MHDGFVEDNEQTFSWDRVKVADDDRTLTLTGIHSPPWSSSEDSWWAFARAEVSEFDDAVGVRISQLQQRPGAAGAYRASNPEQTVEVVLERPLAGRVVFDATAKLERPKGGAGGEPVPWERWRVANDSTLVVYWHGGAGGLDHLELDWEDDALLLTVREVPVMRLSGHYWAAIVRLDRPLGAKPVVDGAVVKAERARARRIIPEEQPVSFDQPTDWQVEVEVRSADPDFDLKWTMLAEHEVPDVEPVHWGIEEDGDDVVCTASLRVRAASSDEARALGHRLVDAVGHEGPRKVDVLRA